MKNRDELGRKVREAWVRWALTQPDPKSSWLVDYDDLSECDKEADRQIGEAIAQFSWPTEPTPSPRIVELEARNAELEGLVERLKLEAQIHAGEAKAANSTLYEIYQLCSGATGEKGNWNGAAPVRAALSTAEARGRQIGREEAAKVADEYAANSGIESSWLRGARHAGKDLAAAIRASALSTNEAGE